MLLLISRNKHTITNIIRYRTMNIQYQRKIIDIEFVQSISWGLNRYRIIDIDIEAMTSISKLQLGAPRADCGIHVLVVGSMRLLYNEE
jgi:hypothetical protein